MNKKKKKQYKDLFKTVIERINKFYLTFDNSLIINGKTINLKNTKVKTVSLDYNADSYFDFFSSIASYRERLKENITEDKFESILESSDNSSFFEFRIKNINSIFSKIHQYVHVKDEHGEVPIIKCLNDLFGARFIVNIKKIDDIKQILNELKDENGWNCDIINASKKEYKAIHLYLRKDNYSLKWEIQFWSFKNESANRLSHSKYKQSYTKWEKTYTTKELFEVVK